MRIARTILLALAACALASGVHASPAAPKNEVDYLTLPFPEKTDTGSKVEVIEFFAYYCPHCNAFQPKLAEWVKRQGANIVYKRVHVERGAPVMAQQRLYFTLEAMGLADQYHHKVFDAMHKDQRLPLSNDEQVFDWAEKAGIERVKFIDTYRSGAVQARIKRAADLMRIYQVNRWPYVAIGGRYTTSPSQLRNSLPENADEDALIQGALQVMDHLVDQSRAGQK
jgi:protein dithiol oxidoreductase (disulfide-forming)